MRYVLCLFAGAGLALGGVLLLPFLDDNRAWLRSRRTVTVSGTATVRVSPDCARISFATWPMKQMSDKANMDHEGNTQDLKKDLDKILKKYELVRRDVLTRQQVVFSSRQENVEADGDSNSPPRKTANSAEEQAYALITLFTVELEAANAHILQEAADDVAKVSLKHRAFFDSAPRFFGDNRTPPQVTYYRRDTAAERQRALDDAVTAAGGDAQKLAGPKVSIEVIEITEQTPQPVVLTITNESHPSGVYGGMGGSFLQPSQTKPGGQLGGSFSPTEQKSAIDSELTCKVIVKFAY